MYKYVVLVVLCTATLCVELVASRPLLSQSLCPARIAALGASAVV